jgi:hypothetical protein
VNVGRAAEQDRTGQTLKQTGSQEREATVFQGLFGGRTGETADGKKGTEVFRVRMEKLREIRRAISTRKLSSIPTC